MRRDGSFAIMDQIYQFAWATIVALNSTNAHCRLPRVSVPGNSSQTILKVGDYEFRAVLPTLQAQVQNSTWAKRAWTYQEAVLSPRCLYFTQDQMYFECDAGQRCESLDDLPFESSLRQPSWSRNHNSNESDTLGMKPGSGVFRNTTVAVS